MEKLLLRPIEVSELLGIGRSRAYELIGAGVLPSIKIGSSVRVPVESLRAWIEAQGDDAAKAALGRRMDQKPA
jgi:excisionase family DNA binding protein